MGILLYLHLRLPAPASNAAVKRWSNSNLPPPSLSSALSRGVQTPNASTNRSSSAKRSRPRSA